MGKFNDLTDTLRAELGDFYRGARFKDGDVNTPGSQLIVDLSPEAGEREQQIVNAILAAFPFGLPEQNPDGLLEDFVLAVFNREFSAEQYVLLKMCMDIKDKAKRGFAIASAMTQGTPDQQNNLAAMALKHGFDLSPKDGK